MGSKLIDGKLVVDQDGRRYRVLGSEVRAGAGGQLFAATGASKARPASVKQQLEAVSEDRVFAAPSGGTIPD